MKPKYCITADTDWASEDCLDYFLGMIWMCEVRPTLFVTHESLVVRDFMKAYPDSIGIHPNFAAGSTHGNSMDDVIDHMFELYPDVRSFRSHGFVDSTQIIRKMQGRGIEYDTNLCLYLQPDIVPLRLGASGTLRFPVFWEDDVHWSFTDDWNFKNFVHHFETPGLKIINVHPVNIALNIQTAAQAQEMKPYTKTLTIKEIHKLRYSGFGPLDFLLSLIKFVKSTGQRFYVLDEIYKFYSP